MRSGAVLRSPAGVHDRVTGYEAAGVRRSDRVDGQLRSHVRRDRVSDQFLAVQVQDSREVEPALAGREAADIPGQPQAGRRRGELPPDQVWDDRRALVRLRKVPALALRDPGDAVRPHQPCQHAPAYLDALALEFSGDALRAVGWTRRVDLHDPHRELLLVVRALAAANLSANPTVEAAPVRDRNAAQSLDAEPIAQPADEYKALTCGREMDQRLRGLAQNLILDAQALDLALMTANLAAHLRDDGFK